MPPTEPQAHERYGMAMGDQHRLRRLYELRCEPVCQARERADMAMEEQHRLHQWYQRKCEPALEARERRAMAAEEVQRVGVGTRASKRFDGVLHTAR